MQLENKMKLRPSDYVFLLLMSVLIGCSSFQEIRPTETSNVSNATPSPYVSNDKMITPTKTVLPTSSQEILETPMPTLSVEESTKFIKELLLNNGGCKLPCFWGIVPGTTEWNNAKVFLKTFAEIREGIYYSIKIQDPEYPRVNLIEFKVQEGIIVEVVAGPPITRNFTVDKILIDYGKPEEVYLLTYKNAPASPVPAFLVLNYQHQGILAQYEFASEKINDIEFSICSQPIGPSMWLRSPKKMLTELEINQSVLGPEPSYTLRKIDEVSDISVEEFYDKFKGSSACFITPINIWP
jgi:hypothetical protein